MSRLLRPLRRFATATKHYDAVVIGGGPVGTEIARLCGLVGRRVAVVDPRGALLAAPTGYVSKVLLQCSNDVEDGVCEGAGPCARNTNPRCGHVTAAGWR